jgi:DNA-binding response OmpR family regulator
MIYLLEDDDSIRKLVIYALESQGYQARGFSLPGEFWEAMRQSIPDLVLLDIMLPQEDGLSILSRLRAGETTARLPVIMLTAKDDDESKTEAMKRGANNYVTKPFSIEYLKACVEQLLSQRELFRQRIVVEEENSSDEYARQLDKRDRGFISSVHDIIDLHISEKEFNMDSIAQQLGVSRSSFFKKVKSLTGYSPMDLLKEYRMNKAEKLLRTTEHTISSIAFQSGFSDISYFGKCFRKKYGVSPKEYREKMRS